MKFYNIGLTNNLNVIGHYPQTVRIEGYHVDFVNNVKADYFPDYLPKYGLKLNSSSKPTDVIDRGILTFGFVISEKLKIILSKFKLPPHKFYSIEVAGSSSNYYWFHYISNMEKFINFEKSEIEVFETLPPFNVEETLSLSFDEILKLKSDLIMKRGRSLRYKVIQLNNSFPDYDLFEITGAQNITLISETLKKEFINNGITGFEISEFINLKKII